MDGASVMSTDEQVSQVIQGGVSTKKLHHKVMVLEGCCANCAHCGQKLTDSQSVLTGIGPTCRKKAGYSDPPVDGDEMQAMIDLAEFPELVAFLTEHYKPQGLRGLVNGLVRVASLNRPRGLGQSEGNISLFDACCDSIESLGHKGLAQLLRETLVTVEVTDADHRPGFVEVQVKRRVWTRDWFQDVHRICGTVYDRREKKLFVLVHKSEDKDMWAFTGKTTNKRLLWEAIVRHFPGQVVRTSKGVFKAKALD